MVERRSSPVVQATGFADRKHFGDCVQLRRRARSMPRVFRGAVVADRVGLCARELIGKMMWVISS